MPPNHFQTSEPGSVAMTTPSGPGSQGRATEAHQPVSEDSTYNMYAGPLVENPFSASTSAALGGEAHSQGSQDAGMLCDKTSDVPQSLGWLPPKQPEYASSPNSTVDDSNHVQGGSQQEQGSAYRKILEKFGAKREQLKSNLRAHDPPGGCAETSTTVQAHQSVQELAYGPSEWATGQPPSSTPVTLKPPKAPLHRSSSRVRLDALKNAFKSGEKALGDSGEGQPEQVEDSLDAGTQQPPSANGESLWDAFTEGVASFSASVSDGLSGFEDLGSE